jgi:very-long-chain enoyl-CoA reductase
MATQLLTLTVLPRGKPIRNLPEETALPRAAPASEIYQTLAKKTGTSVHRIRVTKGSDGQVVPNDKDIPINETGLLDGSKIFVKDLGNVQKNRFLVATNAFRPSN